MAFIGGPESDLAVIGPPDRFSAIAIGPGMGTSEDAESALTTLLNKNPNSLVLDADALNLIATHPDLLQCLPKKAILTPHPGEFKRLAGNWHDDFDKLEKLRNYATQHSIFVVLKGAFTIVATPSGELHFNSTGNPGMATGGSGDILTGVIVSLLAQQYSHFEACVLGVYLHGLAGDLAACKVGMASLTPEEIIGHLSEAWLELSN